MSAEFPDCWAYSLMCLPVFGMATLKYMGSRVEGAKELAANEPVIPAAEGEAEGAPRPAPRQRKAADPTHACAVCGHKGYLRPSGRVVCAKCYGAGER